MDALLLTMPPWAYAVVITVLGKWGEQRMFPDNAGSTPGPYHIADAHCIELGRSEPGHIVTLHVIPGVFPVQRDQIRIVQRTVLTVHS